MKSLKIAVLILTVICNVAFGATAAPSVESFFKDPDVWTAVLSPQGHYVAILSRVDDHQVLAVRDTSDLNKFTIASAAIDNKILSVHWVNENRLVFVLKNTHLEYEGGNYDLYAVNRDGTELVELISGSWRHHQNITGSNIGNKTLTADYGLYGVTGAGNSDDVIVERYTFNNVDMYSTGTHLFRLNTKTQKMTELLDGLQPANVDRWILDSNDVPRFARSEKAGQCTTYYYSPESKKWSELSHGGCLEREHLAPLAFENENSIYVAADYNGYGSVFKYDLKTQKIASEPIVTINGFDFAGSLERDHVTGKVLGFHFDSDARSTVWLDSRFNDYQKKIDAVLPQTVNTVTCGADCLNSPALLVISSSDRQPTQYFIYSTANGKIVGLGGAHPDIKPAQMGLRDFYRYQARDGRAIPVYVTMPPGKPALPLPTIVLAHGGPFARVFSWEWESEAQFLASRGYVVIEPEFRGSTGFGFDHFHAGWKQWGMAMQDDLTDAVKWAEQKGWVDPKRVGIMGASYGGYATLMGLIKTPEIFRCGVEWVGVTDLKMMFSLAESDATVDDLKYEMRDTVGDPEVDSDMFKENSPLMHANKLTQPLLMAAGALDARVPIAQATAFHNAVTQKNNNVEWIVYADEGHGWQHEQNSIDFWKHVETFLDKNLKNVSE